MSNLAEATIAKQKKYFIGSISIKLLLSAATFFLGYFTVPTLTESTAIQWLFNANDCGNVANAKCDVISSLMSGNDILSSETVVDSVV